MEPRFADDHPLLMRVRKIALGFPGAQEKVSVGLPAFYTRKVFCWFAMSYKRDGNWVEYPEAIAVLLPEPERLAVLASPQGYLPSYIGPSGWAGLLLNENTDWAEVAELIEESYRMTAGKRLVAELDARLS